MSFELSTDGMRLVPFPYQVKWAGATVESSKEINDFYFTDRMEICFRISSSEDAAVDEIDGRIYRTPFPHVFFKYPFHRLRYSYLLPRNAIHFSYSPETLENLRKAGILPAKEVFFHPFELTPELRGLIRRFTELMEHSLERKALDRLDLTAFELLQEILMQQKAPDRKRNYRQDDILAIASFLKQSFNREIDFGELALRHGMSLRTFFRHWEKHFKETPAHFILNLKLEEAARQLRETSYSVDRIASFVRLGDSAYFAKVFRKKYQMTPLQFRSTYSPRRLLECVGTLPKNARYV